MLALADTPCQREAVSGKPPPLVVVMGASAGGMDALQKLLPQLRPNGVTAYVVVQHLSNSSHLTLIHQLLQRSCVLPVRLMETGAAPEADAVVLVPAGCHAYWDKDRWTLRPPLTSYVYVPSVDALLQSLAEGLGPRAAAVILSGAGNDGARGALELQRRGGRVWVQAPEQARFDGMPLAVKAAVPDAQVLRVEAMAAAWRWWTWEDTSTPSMLSAGLQTLLGRVRLTTGADFSGYKPETLERRTTKRMQELGLSTMADYLSRVDADPQEAWTLQRRFLVSVSSFFRDRACFEALSSLWRQHLAGTNRHWRCWVPACATGEEAYTLAMLFAEGCRAGHWSGELDVLGTDLNGEAINHAVRARYNDRALTEVTEPIRQRYFTGVGDAVEVVPSVRSCVKFAQQDVMTTQPDGPWDVISCRNLLIYLQPSLQEHLISLFHTRLAPGGWLFISPVETLPQACLRWFAPYDMNHRIYRKLP